MNPQKTLYYLLTKFFSCSITSFGMENFILFIWIGFFTHSIVKACRMYKAHQQNGFPLIIILLLTDISRVRSVFYPDSLSIPN